MMRNKEHENKNEKHKKARFVWTLQLHHKFLAAVTQLGIDEAVPRKILELMKDEKLTRFNVASHLQQKYKLHLKRISTSVAHQQQGSISYDFGQFHNTGLNSPSVQNAHELPSSGTNQFGQNHNTNGDGYQHGGEVIPISECFCNQCPDSLTDMHSQLGVLSRSTPSQGTSNVPFEWWVDHNQDNASYHSNVIGSSINSLTLVNGVVDPEANTSTNSTFNRNLDYNFCDPLQMKNDGIMELTEENSSLKQQQQQVYIMNQHKSRNSCIVNNVGSPEDLTIASSGCSQRSKVSAEIAKLRQDMVTNRDENRQLREIVQAMKAQQDILTQAVLQIVPPSSISPSHPGCSPMSHSSEWMTSFPDIH